MPRLYGHSPRNHPSAPLTISPGLPALPQVCLHIGESSSCHGVPGSKRLKAGDIVNIDVTVIKDGFHGDTSRMFFVGEPHGAPTGRYHL